MSCRWKFAGKDQADLRQRAVMLMPQGIHIFRAFTGQDFPERTGVVPRCCRRNLPALLYMAVNLEAMILFQFWQPVCEIGVTERDMPGFVPRNCALMRTSAGHVNRSMVSC